MERLNRLCLSLFFCGLATSVEAMEALSDGDLGMVTGREGVLVSFDYFYNSDPATGALDTSYCGSDPGNPANCVFSWQIANRDDGSGYYPGVANSGEWLVYKYGHLSLSLSRLSLDGGFLSNAESASSAYESFFDVSRFEDVDGNCLLGAGNCNTGYIASMPALRTHYPETGNGYNDMRLALSFHGLAVEYDTNGTPGYLLNDKGSFMGMNIRDVHGDMAGISFGGDFYLYGF